jgi:hypothetical protein
VAERGGMTHPHFAHLWYAEGLLAVSSFHRMGPGSTSDPSVATG